MVLLEHLINQGMVLLEVTTVTVVEMAVELMDQMELILMLEILMVVLEVRPLDQEQLQVLVLEVLEAEVVLLNYL